MIAKPSSSFPPSSVSVFLQSRILIKRKFPNLLMLSKQRDSHVIPSYSSKGTLAMLCTSSWRDVQWQHGEGFPPPHFISTSRQSFGSLSEHTAFAHVSVLCATGLLRLQSSFCSLCWLTLIACTDQFSGAELANAVDRSDSVNNQNSTLIRKCYRPRMN